MHAGVRVGRQGALLAEDSIARAVSGCGRPSGRAGRRLRTGNVRLSATQFRVGRDGLLSDTAAGALVSLESPRIGPQGRRRLAVRGRELAQVGREGLRLVDPGEGGSARPDLSCVDLSDQTRDGAAGIVGAYGRVVEGHGHLADDDRVSWCGVAAHQSPVRHSVTYSVSKPGGAHGVVRLLQGPDRRDALLAKLPEVLGDPIPALTPLRDELGKARSRPLLAHECHRDVMRSGQVDVQITLDHAQRLQHILHLTRVEADLGSRHALVTGARPDRLVRLAVGRCALVQQR